MTPSCSPSSPITRTSLSLICSLIIKSLITLHLHKLNHKKIYYAERRHNRARTQKVDNRRIIHFISHFYLIYARKRHNQIKSKSWTPISPIAIGWEWILCFPVSVWAVSNTNTLSQHPFPVNYILNFIYPIFHGKSRRASPRSCLHDFLWYQHALHGSGNPYCTCTLLPRSRCWCAGSDVKPRSWSCRRSSCESFRSRCPHSHRSVSLLPWYRPCSSSGLCYRYNCLLHRLIQTYFVSSYYYHIFSQQ